MRQCYHLVEIVDHKHHIGDECRCMAALRHSLLHEDRWLPLYQGIGGVLYVFSQAVVLDRSNKTRLDIAKDSAYGTKPGVPRDGEQARI